MKNDKRVMTWSISCLLAVVFLIAQADAGEHSKSDPLHHGIEPANAETVHRHVHPVDMEKPDRVNNVGVDEQLGQVIPRDIPFKDENGEIVRIGDYLTKPVILLPVFFHCPQACNMMLGSLASALNEVPLAPGKDYRVLAFSFDDEEDPDAARSAKNNYLPILKNDFPEDQWKFITGEKKHILMLTKAMGYQFQKTGKHVFIHPNALIVLAPDGKIIRYLYGVHFLPFDIGMALTEAAEGIPQLSIRKVLTYCFDYDSEQRTYVFKTFRILATGMLALLFLFFWFVLRKNRE